MKTVFSIVSMLLLSSCASLGAKFDAARAKSVHKVAILAVEIQQEQPKASLGLSKAGEFKSGPISESAEFKGHAKDVYVYLAAELANKTGWRVVDYKNMTSNPAFAAVFKEKMEGARLTQFKASANDELIFPPGILDSFAFRKLTPAQKAELARKAGADAYAELVIYQTIDQGWSIGNLTGDAAFSFKSRANLTVYGLDGDDPVWRIQNVDGDSSANSSTLAKNLTKSQKLAANGLESAKSALNKLMDKFPGH